MADPLVVFPSPSHHQDDPREQEQREIDFAVGAPTMQAHTMWVANDEAKGVLPSPKESSLHPVCMVPVVRAFL